MMLHSPSIHDLCLRRGAAEPDETDDRVGCRSGPLSFDEPLGEDNRPQRMRAERRARPVITISAFKSVPDFARGQVRDLRVRWALEEAGLSYKTRLLEQGDQDKPDYRALQPFGQVPIFEENGVVLFETGAIVLHIGEGSETLLPRDGAAR